MLRVFLGCFRRRGRQFFKITTFLGIFWIIVVFGFLQKSRLSSVGISDIEAIPQMNEVKLEKNENLPRENEFSGEKVDKVELKRGIEIKQPDFDEIKEKFEEKIEVPRNDVAEIDENVWTFVKPPNIFNNDSVGELALPWKLPEVVPTDIKQLVEEGWKNHQFNQYLSDLISVHRKLRDYRGEYCKVLEESYSKNLPATSVIIIFHNEAWSTLLRSVHSVLDRSPEHLITEVILVDDFSDMEHLKRPLEIYMNKLQKVKILRAKERGGLIKARLLGAAAAKGPVLTFLDSHIEATPGWLEPLLDRVATDPRNVVCPVISIIDTTNFQISAFNAESLAVGGFDWKMTFNWHGVPEAEKKRKTNAWEPTRSPAMAGGLFSIDKAYFEHLGTYDKGMDIWGAENIEISIRIWTCGGKLEIVPCSQVAHIFRKASPYKWRPGVNVARINTLRMVEVWLDDYAKFYYARNGKKTEDIGDISDRLQLRKELKCQSFQWYLDNVYPELKPADNLVAMGEIRNLGYGGQRCLDTKEGINVYVVTYQCHGWGSNQFWETSIYANNLLMIKRDIFAFESDGKKLKLNASVQSKRDQSWFYIKDSQQLFHPATQTCLSMNSTFEIQLQKCDQNDTGQKWQFENINSNRIPNQLG